MTRGCEHPASSTGAVLRYDAQRPENKNTIQFASGGSCNVQFLIK